jgi:hypothetical protein
MTDMPTFQQVARSYVEDIRYDDNNQSERRDPFPHPLHILQAKVVPMISSWDKRDARTGNKAAFSFAYHGQRSSLFFLSFLDTHCLLPIPKEKASIFTNKVSS